MYISDEPSTDNDNSHYEYAQNYQEVEVQSTDKKQSGNGHYYHNLLNPE